MKMSASFFDDYNELDLTGYKSKLTINNSLIFYFPREAPNFIHRFLQRVFLGFKWEKLS